MKLTRNGPTDQKWQKGQVNPVQGCSIIRLRISIGFLTPMCGDCFCACGKRSAKELNINIYI